MNVEKWIQLNNQAAGRDKLARLIQYLSRAVWDALDKVNSSPSAADSFRTIEYILSTFRKLLRFGKCLDVFYASLKTVHHPNLVIRITLTLSKLSQSLFLLADHFLWLARTGLFKSINTKKWGQLANKYWLFSIIMNLCRDFYEIIRLIDIQKCKGHKSGISRFADVNGRASINSPSDLGRLALQSYAAALDHKDVLVDTVKNVCDFFIPFTALGYSKMSPRTIGILGAISSVAGIIALVEPRAKLSPA